MECIYSKDLIIKSLNRGIQLNANSLTSEVCYNLCANKQKLDLLLSRENEVVFGRRGTGKTTLFKAFTYYIQNIYAKTNPHIACWYVRLDNCIAPDLKDCDISEISLHGVKNFLLQFWDFLSSEYDRMESGLDKYRREKILGLLVELGDIIRNGGDGIVIDKRETWKNKKTDSSTVKVGGKISLPNIIESFLQFGRKKQTTNDIEETREYKSYFNIPTIQKYIEDILSSMMFQTVYICIDEFTQIDRDVTFTIQPKVAQLLKQIFFDSKIVVIKIASVWNEYRMQSRQTIGKREGIELGNDIFSRNELNLDVMFEYDNDKANNFFKKQIANYFLNGSKTYQYEFSEKEPHSSNEEIIQLGEYIVERIFAKNSFRYLICGSQGIPRDFGNLLKNCLSKMIEQKTDKIGVNTVFESIIGHYNSSIRHRIPYSSPLCVRIDDYVFQKKIRFFLVNMEMYNIGINYFDGLVANNALHQCPSAQLPRSLKNKYKMFFVHYGSYLECFENGLSVMNLEAKVGDALLYPIIPKDLEQNVSNYILKLDKECFDDLYCTYCHKSFKRSEFVEGKAYRCPNCNQEIAWL